VLDVAGSVTGLPKIREEMICGFTFRSGSISMQEIPPSS